MAGPTSPEPRQDAKTSEPHGADALRARLDALKADLGEATNEERLAHLQNEQGGSTGQAMGTGMRVASELVSGTLVGFGIGYFFDSSFGTSPFGLIGFLLVGIAAGFRNIYRLGMRPTSSTASTPKQ